MVLKVTPASGYGKETAKAAPTSNRSQNLTTYKEIAQFCYAAWENNERALLELLRSGYDINATIGPDSPCRSFSSDLESMSALRFACLRDETTSIEVLLDNGADFTVKNSSGSTVLHSLAEFECEEPSRIMKNIWNTSECGAMLILSAHVKYNVTTNPVNKHGLSHFHIACLYRHAEAVKLFINSGVPINDVIHKDSPILPGFTALHIACRYASLEVVELLMENGADVHARNKDGLVPLQLILPRVEELSFLALDRDEFQDDRELHCKLEVDTYEIASILIQKTIDSETLINQLCIACAKKCTASVHEIIDKGLDINARNDFGLTALHCAALVDFNVTKLLLERGADLFSKTTDGTTCLDLCIWKYGYDTLRLLPFDEKIGKYIVKESQSWKIAESLQNKTNLKNLLSDDEVAQEINAACITSDSPVWPGVTPLHLAIIFTRRDPRKKDRGDPRCSTDLVQTLLSRGASMLKQDAKGQTPVHTALYCEKFEILSQLLNPYNLSPDIRRLISSENPVDDTGLSHFHIACLMGYQKSINLLLSLDKELINKPLKSFVSVTSVIGKPEILLEAGSTPLHIAAKSKKIETIKALAALDADIFAQNADGLTPIDVIASNSEFEELELVDLTYFLFMKYCYSNSNFVLDEKKMVRFITLCKALNPIVLSSRYSSAKSPSVESALAECMNQDGGCQEENLRCVQAFIDCSEKIKLLMNYNLDCDAKAAKSMTSLKKIFEKGPQDSLSPRECFVGYTLSKSCHCFCKSNASVDKDTQMTYLHLTCALNIEEWLESVVKEDTDFNCRTSLDSPIFPGSTPLHFALNCCTEKTVKEFVKLVQIMLNYGADPTIQDTKDETPLHLADRFGFSEIVELLLRDERVAKKNLISKFGQSHFHIACSNDISEVVERFLQHGADVNELNYYVDNRLWNSDYIDRSPRSSEFTPLHVANNLHVIKVLSKHGADPGITDYRGFTALHCAAQRLRDADVLKALIRDAGADVHSKSALQETALDLLVNARLEDHEEYDIESEMQVLLEHGARANYENNGAPSTFARVLKSNDVELLETLAKYGTDLNDLNKSGRTAMHELFYGYLESADDYILITDLLCQNGVDIDCQDSLGETPLHVAVQNENPDKLIALLACGADLNTIDNNKCTPLSSIVSKDSLRSDAYAKLSSTLKKRISILTRHIRKMQAFNVAVVRQNTDLLKELFGIDDSEIHASDSKETQQSDELKKMETVALGENMSLNDVMFMDSHQLGSLAENDAFKSVLSSEKFHQEFPELGGILKLKFRTAQRRKVINLARKHLYSLLRMQLPETCTEIIAACLSNRDLKRIIHETAVK
ncbi:hypothetical protein QAD02_011480 [Eretmocerus hayati]|uniref:Uncharacterized protein n=1 Tax=Eretmocerus hayati TaxID=131215 RepID=A0ACC2NZH7_9HYME|nr:hypothetical protein QAD02_011480 [Eretmocerus hayati]